MRLGIVLGHVVLSRALPALQGTSLLLVEPVTAANLAARNGRGGGKTLVVADQLSPATGQMIGVVEGSEAANPYPGPTPVDAYCALIVNDYTFQPPETDRPVGRGRTRMSALDLTALRVIAAKHIDQAASRGAKEIITRKGAVITPLAADAMQRRALTLRQADGPAAPCSAAKDAKAAPKAPAASPASRRSSIRRRRSGSRPRSSRRARSSGTASSSTATGATSRTASARTKCSARRRCAASIDLTPELICMVDLEGNQLAGSAARTSEIFLHLQIYKTVPEAKGVVHCHPPHATAYAITGRVPPSGIVPEFDVFVGAVALAPVRDARHPAVCGNGDAVRQELQHRAARQPRDRLLGGHGDARGMVRRGARNVLLDADDRRRAAWRAGQPDPVGEDSRTCSTSRGGWACRIRVSLRTSARSPSPRIPTRRSTASR